MNNFAQIKQNPHQSSLLQFENFKTAHFEKKIHTGISTPILDFYLETTSRFIGVESKFTEYLRPKKPNNNLEKYIDTREFAYLPDALNKLIKQYLNDSG